MANNEQQHIRKHSVRTCNGSAGTVPRSTVGESKNELLSAPSSPVDDVFSFCKASFSVRANFSNDFEHVFSFTSYRYHKTISRAYTTLLAWWNYIGESLTLGRPKGHQLGHQVTSEHAPKLPGWQLLPRQRSSPEQEDDNTGKVIQVKSHYIKLYLHNKNF